MSRTVNCPHTAGLAFSSCCCGDNAKFATTRAPAVFAEVAGIARKLALPTVPSASVSTFVVAGKVPLATSSVRVAGP